MSTKQNRLINVFPILILYLGFSKTEDVKEEALLSKNCVYGRELILLFDLLVLSKLPVETGASTGNNHQSLILNTSHRKATLLFYVPILG